MLYSGERHGKGNYYWALVNEKYDGEWSVIYPI